MPSETGTITTSTIVIVPVQKAFSLFTRRSNNRPIHGLRLRTKSGVVQFSTIRGAGLFVAAHPRHERIGYHALYGSSDDGQISGQLSIDDLQPSVDVDHEGEVSA